MKSAVDEFKHKTGSNLIESARDLGLFLHQGVLRQTGHAYEKHLRFVSRTGKRIIKPSEYSESFESAGWLHDSAEDTSWLEVYNPFDPPRISERDSEMIYLNDLLADAKEQGEWACYVVDKMTRRGERYFDYMGHKFNLSQQGITSDLDLLSLILKMIDKRDNTRADEVLFTDGLLKVYRNLRDEYPEKLSEFYYAMKIHKQFKQKGDYSYDEQFFVDTVTMSFEQKKILVALDNLWYIIPKAETTLLEPYHEHSHRLFHYSKMRGLLKEAFTESLEILKNVLPDYLEISARMGYNKGNVHVPGYISLITEIETEN